MIDISSHDAYDDDMIDFPDSCLSGRLEWSERKSFFDDTLQKLRENFFNSLPQTPESVKTLLYNLKYLCMLDMLIYTHIVTQYRNNKFEIINRPNST